MVDDNFAALSVYEKRAYRELEARRAKALEKSPRQLVPAKVRESAVRRGKQLKERVSDYESQQPWLQKVGGALRSGTEGLARMTNRIAHTTLSEQRVIKSYGKHHITNLEDIRQLDLKVVDSVRPKRFDFYYAGAAALEGMASGAVITGGEVLAAGGSVAGVGAGGVPGFGTVAATMATDAGILIAASSRAVAHTAMYFGYDPNDPAEQVFAMSVISLGTAGSTAAKTVAYQELSQLAQQLARRATWKVLDAHLVTKVAKAFAARMSVRLTQRKLGQLVPVLGIGIGAGLNYLMLDKVCTAAYWSYRERFLVEKMGGGGALVAATVDDDLQPNDDVISVIDIVGEVEQDKTERS